MKNTFATNLKYFRERAGLSQSALAKIIEVTPATIGLYEQGRRQPNFEIEEKIADYFNVDLDTLRGTTSSLSLEQLKLLEKYDKLDDLKKLICDAVLDTLIESQAPLTDITTISKQIEYYMNSNLKETKKDA